MRFDDLWMIDILSGCQIHSGDFDDEKVTSFLPDREFVMPPVTREGGNDAEELFTRENSIEKCVEKLVGIWISRLLLFLTVDFYPLMGYRIEFKRNASWRGEKLFTLEIKLSESFVSLPAFNARTLFKSFDATPLQFQYHGKVLIPSLKEREKIKKEEKK